MPPPTCSFAASSWTEQERLVQPPRYFGQAVSLSGDTRFVGAWGVHSASDYAGAAHVYERNGPTWTLQQTLTASDASEYAMFGYAVASSGDRAVTTAANTGSFGEGTAYVFRRTAGVWSEVDKVTASERIPEANYGFSAALSADTALVGTARTVSVAYALALDAGETCSDDSTCATGVCADGVCCDRPCAGGCAVCGAALGASQDGRCTALPAGDEGDCAPGACNGVSGDCPAGCARHADCVATYFCDTSTGASLPKKANGQPCGDERNAECASDVCVVKGSAPSGVCCDVACDGACSSCRAADQEPGGQDGVCASMRAGTDPYALCPDGPANSCGPDGLWDGEGACRAYALAGAACGETLCVGATLAGLLCNGAGECGTGTEGSCGLYACADDGKACRSNCTDDARCIPHLAHALHVKPVQKGASHEARHACSQSISQALDRGFLAHDGRCNDHSLQRPGER